MNKIKLICTALLFFGNTVLASTPAMIPNDSVYQLPSQWHDQNNNPLQLAQLGGKRQIVSMIYTHCLHTCPTIVATMKAVEDKLTPEQKSDVGFVLISLTPDSDTPAVLKDFAQNRKLSDNWTLLTGDASDVRALSMALNVKYKDTADNEVAHTNLMTVLDGQGRILFQELGIPGKDKDVIALLGAGQ